MRERPFSVIYDSVTHESGGHLPCMASVKALLVFLQKRLSKDRISYRRYPQNHPKRAHPSRLQHSYGQRSLKSFDVAVLSRTPGLRVQNFDSVSIAPILKFMRNEFMGRCLSERCSVCLSPK